MSKKHKQRDAAGVAHYAALTPDQVAEYNTIKWDLVRLVILNVIFLIAVLAVYYTNLESHYLENWFSRYFHL